MGLLTRMSTAPSNGRSVSVTRVSTSVRLIVVINMESITNQPWLEGRDQIDLILPPQVPPSHLRPPLRVRVKVSQGKERLRPQE